MGLLGLLELARLAGPTLAKMALDGELRWRHVWTALEGSEKYLEAIEAGDVADAAVAQTRASICAACPACTRDQRFIRDEAVVVGWCGKRFEDRCEAAEPTCGCMVWQKVELSVGWTGGLDKTVTPEVGRERDWGRAVAAGKTMVGSEKCPRGKW
jgi:hypothetical protein